mgnify:CR=1 FL=1
MQAVGQHPAAVGPVLNREIPAEKVQQIIAQAVIRLLRQLLLSRRQRFCQRVRLRQLQLHSPRSLGCIGGGFRSLIQQPYGDGLFLLSKIQRTHHAFFGGLAAQKNQAPPDQKHRTERAQFLLLHFAAPFPHCTARCHTVRTAAQRKPMRKIAQVSQMSKSSASMREKTSALHARSSSCAG